VWQVTSPDKTVATGGAREFKDQIILPDGRKHVTLRGATTYVSKLRKRSRRGSG
jgi:hypothetical protein